MNNRRIGIRVAREASDLDTALARLRETNEACTDPQCQERVSIAYDQLGYKAEERDKKHLRTI